MENYSTPSPLAGDLFADVLDFGFDFDFNGEEEEEEEVLNLEVDHGQDRFPAPVIPRGKRIKNEMELTNSKGKDTHFPYLKRRKKETRTILYAFPSFDRSDALLFLPSTFARHMNSGDMPALSKLMHSHLCKDCDFKVPFIENGALTLKVFLKLHAMMNVVHPDSVMCAHNTKVIGNKIKASLYLKFTDCVALSNSIRATADSKDELFSPMLKMSREQGMKRHLLLENRPTEEIDQFLNLARTDSDLLVYVSTELEMTIDEITKKVSEFSMTNRLTSMHPVKSDV